MPKSIPALAFAYRDLDKKINHTASLGALADLIELRDRTILGNEEYDRLHDTTEGTC